MTEIERKRYEWWTNALKSNLNWMPVGTCPKCGKCRPGFISYPEHKFTCVICTAEKMFPDRNEPKAPFPVAELRYGSLVPIDEEETYE